MHLFIYRAGDKNELLIENRSRLLLEAKGKREIPCSVELSSLASHVSVIITSSCTEVSCLMLLALYFSQPS